MRIGGYHVLGQLGSGGQGAVYRGWDPSAQREVAIKVLNGTQPKQRARFAREVEALGKLRHPNLVVVHAAGEHAGCPFLVLDLVDGITLSERLRREGPLAPEVAAELVASLAGAVAAAHAQGVLHRDLKPDNVLLGPEGRPLLTDFGLARLSGDSSRLSLTGQVLGTPGYMAPEQAAGERRAVGPATDVYGLGGILYACLTGRPPHEGSNLSELLVRTVSGTPPAPSTLRGDGDTRLDAICLRCLAREPDQRFASAAEVARALRGEWGASRPRWRVRAGVALASALSALCVGWALSRPSEPAASQLALVSSRSQPGTSAPAAAALGQPRGVLAEARAMLGAERRELGRLLRWAREPLLVLKPESHVRALVWSGPSTLVGYGAGIHEWRLEGLERGRELPAAAATDRLLAFGETRGVHGLDPSPAGELVFWIEANSSAWRLPLGGGAPQKLAEGVSATPRWVAPGRLLWAQGRSLLELDPSGGARRARDLPAGVRIVELACDPAGRRAWVEEVSSEEGIGGVKKQQLVVEDEAGRRLFSSERISGCAFLVAAGEGVFLLGCDVYVYVLDLRDASPALRPLLGDETALGRVTHSLGVQDAAAHPGRGFALTCDRGVPPGGEVRVWRLADLEPIARRRADPALGLAPRSVAISPDGALYAVCSSNRIVRDSPVRVEIRVAYFEGLRSPR